MVKEYSSKYFLNDNRIEKVLENALDNGNILFARKYLLNQIDLDEYFKSSGKDKELLEAVNRSCSVIHNRLLKQKKNTQFIRDYLIRYIAESFSCSYLYHGNHNLYKRKHARLLMVVFRYRTFCLSLIRFLINSRYNIPYLDTKKIFNMHGKYLLNMSRRHLYNHVLILVFFKEYISYKDLNFVVDISTKRIYNKLAKKILFVFFNKLTEKQRDILQASILLDEMK